MAIMSDDVIEGDVHFLADLRVFSKRPAASATTPSRCARASLRSRAVIKPRRRMPYVCSGNCLG